MALSKSFWYNMIYALLFFFLPEGSTHRPTRCGGTYTSARGIIQTPNFPTQFTIPIRCTWVIDAQQFITMEDNTNIYVYLTQLYVFEGLIFEEYQIYDDTYQLNGRVLHTVTESNVNKISYIHSKQSYVVITLKLDTIESTHLRVLDHLLAVYGFNITYEISTGVVRPDRCTMLDCGFTGYCYDHYTKFSCDCFEGFTGPSCSQGANSLCTSRKGFAVCKNEGICTHVGNSAVRCDCQSTDFIGDTCDKSVVTGSDDDILGYNGTIRVTGLPNLREIPLKAYIEAQITTALKMAIPSLEQQVRVHTIHSVSRAGTWLVNWHLDDRTRRLEVKLQATIMDWIRLGHVGEIALADPISTPDGSQFNLVELSIDPPPVIQAIKIYPPGPIRIGDDITISCMVNGISDPKVNWINDDYYIGTNISGSNKWSQIKKITPSLNEHVLGINAITALDAGVVTCQVLDNQYKLSHQENKSQHCLSVLLNVRIPPRIWIEPLSLTVRKGENFTLKCFSALANTSSNHILSNSTKNTYSWTKNKVLLPIKTDTEHYEVLYPMGTILQVSSINKSTTFSCLVQDETVLWSEQSILVHVVDKDRVHTCPGEQHQGLLWPETAPGTSNVQECPKGDYQGQVRRDCSLRDGTRQPIWHRPDYSRCTPKRLIAVITQFHRLSLGYSKNNSLTSESLVITTLNSYLSYMQEAYSRQAFQPKMKPILQTTTIQSLHNTQQSRREELSSTANNNDQEHWDNVDEMLLPGVGANILTMVNDVLVYVNKANVNNVNGGAFGNMVDVVMDIVDRVLDRKDNIINEKQVMLVQEVVKLVAKLGVISFTSNNGLYHNARANIDLTVTKENNTTNSVGVVHIPTHFSIYPSWYTYKLHVSLRNQPSSLLNNTASVVVILYRNLHQFLPQRSVVRLKDGSEMEYEIISPISAAWLFITEDISEKLYCSVNECKFIMEFIHTVKKNHSLQAAWMLVCAKTEFANYGLGWQTGTCITRSVDSTVTWCICSRSGTYALMLVKKPKSMDFSSTPSKKQFLLILGCFCCLLLTTFSTLILLIYWCLRQSCLVFLKVQCCVSIVGTMLTFIYALWDQIPEENHLFVLSILEVCLLIGLSSQLSKLLIVYSELVHLSKMTSIKQTVVLIITGSPLIAVIGNHLVYISMSRRLNSWWLLHGSLSFNIFTSSTSIIVILYFTLYYIIQRKLSNVIRQRDPKTFVALSRVKLLRRSSIIFCCITATIGASVLHINFPTNTIYHFTFCSVCIFLGLSILFCYIIYTETSLWPHLMGACRQRNIGQHSSDASNHLKFFTKPDVANEFIPYDRSNGMTEAQYTPEYNEKVSKTCPISFNTYNNVQFFEQSINSHCSSENSSAMGDNMGLTSAVSNFDFQSPDFAEIKKFTQSDLVASALGKELILYQQEEKHCHSIHPKSADEKVYITNSEHASNPQRISISIKENIVSEVKSKKSLDAVLNSITSDLNYLLNDNYEQGGPCTSNSANGIKKLTRSPSTTIFEEIAEEYMEDGKITIEPSITGSNC